MQFYDNMVFEVIILSFVFAILNLRGTNLKKTNNYAIQNVLYNTI